MKVKNKGLTSFRVSKDIFPYFKMNSIFKLRKLNKNFDNLVSIFLGLSVDKMEDCLKKQYLEKISS